jgi:NAD dependent epimerase/dehydratase family enzyme
VSVLVTSQKGEPHAHPVNRRHRTHWTGPLSVWRRQGHDLWVWSRTPQQVEKLCLGSKGIAHLDSLDGSAPFDAVVNLAGAPIATHRWSAERCELLWNSRIDLTRTLVDWMGRQVSIPPVLISGSAVGWYGDGEEQWLSEDSSPGNIDFGSRLCVAWEQEAARARQIGSARCTTHCPRVDVNRWNAGAAAAVIPTRAWRQAGQRPTVDAMDTHR